MDILKNDVTAILGQIFDMKLQENKRHSTMTTGLDKKYNTFINIFNPKKKLVGGAPLHVKRAETPLSTSFFLGFKCFITYMII